MKFILITFLSVLLGVCQTNKNKTNTPQDFNLNEKTFKGVINKDTAHLYKLSNDSDMIVYLTNFGARIVSIIVPDFENKPTDVVLGFNKATDYNNENEPFFGPIVGPFANRIAGGKFSTSEKSYQLTVNNGPNTLHGGKQGLHFVHWKATKKDNSIIFSYTHPDGKDGFPGNIDIQVTYTLLNSNQLKIDYAATTDKETIINLSNHAYFNLNGEGSGSILDHTLQLFADHYTPVNNRLIPTGEIATTKGTPFDFTTPKKIGLDIDVENKQLKFGKGYDHNFVVNQTSDLNHAAQLIGDKSKITLDIYSTEPAIQFYSGNFMSEKVVLKNGSKDSFRSGLCLEPQNFPDAPNHKNFPNSILKPGETYTSSSLYSFTN